MKKLISILLALTLVLSLTVAVSAADPLGSITINNVSPQVDYAVYQMLNLESYDKTSGAYAYKVNSAWVDFFKEGGAGYSYIKYDGEYVQWNTTEDDETLAKFADAALKYADSKGITPTAAYTAPDGAGTTYKFVDLPLGWYLVDSTAGALCGLTTTDPDASVKAKNGSPTIDKQVQEDLTGMYGDVNTADIGQVVEFMTIIHVAAGAEEYTLHDEMSDGLTFLQDTGAGRGITKIEHVNSLGVHTTLAVGTDYVVKYDNCEVASCTHVDHQISHAAGDVCDFEVNFTETFCDTLKPNDRIIVYYNAMLNRNAVIGGAGNENKTKLEYGEANRVTSEDKTTTYTFSIDIIKTDSTNKLIDGAKFKVYDAPTGGNEVRVVWLRDEADGTKVYRRARADELTGAEIEVVKGKAVVLGFDNGIYYLEETKAPDGYNKLTARKEFTIADGNLDAIFNEGIYSTGSGVQVVNKTGSMLPETGAEGTFAFITLGMITVLATGVLLVTKKRMSMIQE